MEEGGSGGGAHSPGETTILLGRGNTSYNKQVDISNEGWESADPTRILLWGMGLSSSVPSALGPAKWEGDQSLGN